jgi:hypothetical protein
VSDHLHATVALLCRKTSVPIEQKAEWTPQQVLTLRRIEKYFTLLLIYKTTLTPIWTYGIQLWGMASTSNIQILERFQSKALRMIVDASWYVPNTDIRRDLQTPTVKEEIRRYSSQYSACLSAHPNDQIVNLMELPDNNRRLRKHVPNDLPTYQIPSVICNFSF